MRGPDDLMTADEVLSVWTALRTETNPSHLFGFASALAPDHCSSASLVHARACILEKRRSFDAPTLMHLLDAVRMAGSRTTPIASVQELVAARAWLDGAARQLRFDPRHLHRAARAAAGDLVLDAQARFPELPAPMIAIARRLLLTVGPVRVLDPAAVRVALPPSTALATDDERESRARWVRHYLREARRGAG